MARTWAASWRMRSSASGAARGDDLECARRGHGRSRSYMTSSTSMASAARASPGPMAAATSAPAAPSGSSIRWGAVGELKGHRRAMLVSERRAYPRGGGRRCAARRVPRSLERAYLNAGTCGPLPRAALRAAHEVLERAGFEAVARPTSTRRRCCAAASAPPTPSAWRPTPPTWRWTTGTSEGAACPARPAPRARRRGPHRARRAPARAAGHTLPPHRGDGPHRALGELAGAVGPRTRLVACSHVSWVTGAIRPEALAAPDGVPVAAARRRAGRRRDPGRRGDARLRLLRGCRAEVALRADRHRPAMARARNGASAWSCSARRSATWPSRPAAWIRRQLDARRHDALAPAEASAVAVAAHEVLAAAGWDAVRAREVAGRRARRPSARARVRRRPARTRRSSPGGPRSACPARPPRRSGRRRPRPPGTGYLRLGGRLERRGRPRAPARRLLPLSTGAPVR